MKNIVIIGAGDFGKEVGWLIDDINNVSPSYNVLGYLDEDDKKIGTKVYGRQVLGKIDYLYNLEKQNEVLAVLAMQDADSREKCAHALKGFNGWETLIHPSAVVSDRVRIGDGCIVCAGVSVSVDTKVGNHCLFNISSTIGHDCIVENYVSVMSGAVVCGHVKVEEKAYLGTNCTVLPGMKVGRHAVVGAGSVALRNVRENNTVMGVPAKRIGV